MSTVEEFVEVEQTRRTQPAARDTQDFLAGEAAIIGMPAFLASALAMALTLLGFVPYSAVAAPVPILTIGGVVQIIAAVRAGKGGQHMLAGGFTIFGVFWLSYSFTTLGLANHWFAMGPDGTLPTQTMFLTSWLVVLVLFTLPTLQMPFTTTALFGLIDIALLMVLLGTVNAGHNLATGLGRTLQFIGGIAVLGFVAVGAYLLVHVTSIAAGGKGLPLGKPVLRRR